MAAMPSGPDLAGAGGAVAVAVDAMQVDDPPRASAEEKVSVRRPPAACGGRAALGWAARAARVSICFDQHPSPPHGVPGSAASAVDLLAAVDSFCGSWARSGSARAVLFLLWITPVSAILGTND